MANRALKGSTAITLLASNFPETTRAVMYTEPTVNAQLMRNMEVATAFEIADLVISTRSRRDPTSVVTNPFPES